MIRAIVRLAQAYTPRWKFTVAGGAGNKNLPRPGRTVSPCGGGEGSVASARWWVGG